MKTSVKGRGSGLSRRDPRGEHRAGIAGGTIGGPGIDPGRIPGEEIPMNAVEEPYAMEAIKAAAERILAATFGSPLRLGSADPLDGSSRSRVTRFSVLEAPGGAAARGVTSVI